jgi:excisionase family DNA binding protein
VPDDVLRATEAARQLGISTKDLLRLVSQHEIRYAMIRGIAHLPRDAVSEYRARIS